MQHCVTPRRLGLVSGSGIDISGFSSRKFSSLTLRGFQDEKWCSDDITWSKIIIAPSQFLCKLRCSVLHFLSKLMTKKHPFHVPFRVYTGLSFGTLHPILCGLTGGTRKLHGHEADNLGLVFLPRTNPKRRDGAHSAIDFAFTEGTEIQPKNN